YLFWFAEFVLEALGTFFFFRRKIPLWIWLGFRALADVASFLALSFLGGRAYLWVDYCARSAGYILFAAAAIWTVAQVLREHPRTRAWYLGLSVVLTAYALLHFHVAWPNPQRALSFELWVELTIAAFVAAAMGVANGKVPRPWGIIACALVV